MGSYINSVQRNNKYSTRQSQQAYRNNGLKTRMVALPPIRPQTVEQAKITPDDPAAPFSVVHQAMESVAKRMEALLFKGDYLQ